MKTVLLFLDNQVTLTSETTTKKDFPRLRNIRKILLSNIRVWERAGLWGLYELESLILTVLKMAHGIGAVTQQWYRPAPVWLLGWFWEMFQSLHNLKLLKVKEVIILIHTLFLEETSVNLFFNGFNLCDSCRVFFHKFQMSSREALSNLVR